MPRAGKRKKHLAWLREIQRQFLEGRSIAHALRTKITRTRAGVVIGTGSTSVEITLREWLEAAHLCARLNERICAMNGWTSVNIRMDPVAAQTAEQPSDHERIRDAHYTSRARSKLARPTAR